MKTFNYIIALSILVSLSVSSCSVEPKEINYGHDHCHYCDMTVIDKTHASEYVTKKGKAFVFDAIECMVNQINEDGNEADLAYILVANYSNPGELIDAPTSGFLISREIKSPMGAFLSAFKSIDEAKAKQSEHGGDIYTWKELQEKFLRK